MKLLHFRFKSIFKLVLIATACIVLLIICWRFYINYHGDEAPDVGRDAFYARSTNTIPDNQNIALAISGINAPAGTDMISHGRLVINTDQNDLLNSDFKTQLINSIGIKFTGKREELDCWLDDALQKTPDNCASKQRIRELLEENKLLIGRYKKLYQITSWQGITHSGGQTLLDVNRLLAADIKLDIDTGKVEAAYQKWKANTVFINHVLKQETTVIEKAIFMVIDGFNLASLEYLLLRQPQVMTDHHQELMIFLKPIGLKKYNLEGMLKADYHFYEDYLFKNVTAEQNIHVNYILNRIYRVHNDFLKEAQKTPFTFKQSQQKLHQRYYFGRYQLWNFDLLDPQHSLISNTVVNGFLSSFNLVRSMQSKSALMKLLNLKINIQQQKIVDTDIQAFLNKAGSEYLNPFTNKPMRWDAKKRSLICDRLNSDETPVVVKL